MHNIYAGCDMWQPQSSDEDDARRRVEREARMLVRWCSYSECQCVDSNAVLQTTPCFRRIIDSRCTHIETLHTRLTPQQHLLAYCPSHVTLSLDLTRCSPPLPFRRVHQLSHLSLLPGCLHHEASVALWLTHPQRCRQPNVRQLR